MRVRLHIDVEIVDDDLVELAEQMTEQPVAMITLPQPFGLLGGRCMSATAVEVPKPQPVMA